MPAGIETKVKSQISITELKTNSTSITVQMAVVKRLCAAMKHHLSDSGFFCCQLSLEQHEDFLLAVLHRIDLAVLSVCAVQPARSVSVGCTTGASLL